MSRDLLDRLNQLKSRLASDEILANKGLGNEIGFYIFDYPPSDELLVRKHLSTVISAVNRKIAVIDLFDLLVEYLEGRKLLKEAIKIQREKGDESLRKALRGVLDEETKIAPEFVRRADPGAHELVIMTGVGKAFPLLRVHRLLNCLQPLMGETPLIVFYPGTYSGQSLSLFGALDDDNYYRAFRLVL